MVGDGFPEICESFSGYGFFTNDGIYIQVLLTDGYKV